MEENVQNLRENGTKIEGKIVLKLTKLVQKLCAHCMVVVYKGKIIVTKLHFLAIIF